jgi:hypothetical protein
MLKMEHVWRWYEIVIMFYNEIKNLGKFMHLIFFIFIQKWLAQNMWHIGAIVNMSINN